MSPVTASEEVPMSVLALFLMLMLELILILVLILVQVLALMLALVLVLVLVLVPRIQAEVKTALERQVEVGVVVSARGTCLEEDLQDL